MSPIDGVTPAFNDVGIVQLPDGRRFAVAVFINDSKENDERNAEAIARISKAAWDFFAAR
jgi:beta-lactamase class A